MRDNLGVLRGACDQLTSCSDFMVLLQAVLSLGNHLNEGTMRGSASGQPPSPSLHFLHYLQFPPMLPTLIMTPIGTSDAARPPSTRHRLGRDCL